MKKSLFIFIAFCLSPLLLGAKEVKIPVVNVTEVAGATAGMPRGQIDRLIDGKKMQFIFWPTWNKKRSSHVDLFFDLQCKADITGLELNLFRRGKDPNEYNLKLLELYVDNGKGTFVPAATWDNPPNISKGRGAVRLKINKVKGQRFKLRIAGVKYFALTEVVFFGEMPQGYTPPPKFKNYYSAIRKNQKALSLRKAVFDFRRGEEYVIESPEMLWVITPERGGMLNYAFDKRSGKNFIKSRQNKDYGALLGDKMQYGSIPQHFRLYHSSYKAEVLENTPEKIVLRVSFNAATTLPGPVIYSKEYTFHKGSAAVTVRHSVSNDSRNVVPYNEPMTFHSSFRGTPGMQRFYFKSSGPQFAPYGFSLDVTDSINAHAGVIDPDGDGLALMHSFKDAATVRFWSSSKEFTTVEVVLGMRPVTADRSEECAIVIVPIRKMKKLHAVFAEGSAGFIKEGKALTLNLSQVENKKFSGKAVYALSKKTIYSGNFGKSTRLTGNYNGESVEVTLRSGDVERKVYYKGKDKFQIPAEFRNVRPVPSRGVSYGKLNLDFTSEDVIIDDGPFIPANRRNKTVWFRGIGYFWCREAVEFARRNGVKAEVFPSGKIFRLGENKQELNPNNSAAVFHEALQKPSFDTLVCMGFAWKNTPENLKKKVLDRVKKGSGLVLISPDPDRKRIKGGKITPAANSRVFAGIPFELLPACDLFKHNSKDTVLVKTGDQPLVTVRNHGKGRIVEIHWNSYHREFVKNKSLGIGLTLPDPTGYRWQHQLVSRAVMYASKAEWQTQPVLKVSAGKLYVTSLPADAALEIVFRDAFDRAAGRKKLTAAEAGKGIVYPGLSQTAEIMAVSGQKVWRGGIVLNKNNSSVKLAFPKELWNVREMLPVKFQSSNMPAGTVFMLRLTDSSGRIFFDGAVSNGVKIPLKKGLGTAFNVELLAHKGGRLLAADSKWLYFDTRHDTNNFTVDCGWLSLRNNGMVDYLIPYFVREMRNMGFNASSQFNIDNPHSRTMLLARQAGMTAPTFGGYGKPGISRPVTNADSPNKFKWVKKLCANSERVQKLEVERAGTMRPFEEISLGRTGVDELNAYVNDWDGCFCKNCLKAMRIYLRKKYGTLENLNTAWKSNFSNWDKVVADSLKEGKAKKHYVSWLDHREFQALSLTEAQAKLVKARRKHDPNAFIAMCGTQDMTPFRALDWADLMKDCGGIYSYLRRHAVIQRSFMPSDRRVFWLHWTGYYYPPEILARRLAMHMALGGSGVAVYSYSYVNPDLSLNSYSHGLARIFRPYLKGAGAVLAQSKDTVPHIGILYNPRGFYLNYALGYPDFSENNVAGIDTALSDVSTDYYWTKIDGISRFKVLFIPAVETLSKEDVRKLEAFVRNGGTLISVMSSGRYDGNGSPVTPQLDKLLGIDSRKAQMSQSVFKLIPDKKWTGFEKILSRYVLLNVRKTTASVLAEVNGTPVVTVNKYGKGKAYFFGCDFWNAYGNMGVMRNFPQFAGARKSVQKFLKSLAVPQRLEVLNGSEPAVGVRMIERKIGAASVFCCIDYLDGDFGKGMPVFNEANPVLTFKSRQKGWFYDLFTGKKLGEGTSFRSNLKHNGYSFCFVRLPYAPPAIKLATVSAGKKSWKITISGNEHPVRITVSCNGKELTAYRKFLPAGKERVFDLDLALNDPAGKYTVQVDDLLSDRSNKFVFEVKK